MALYTIRDILKKLKIGEELLIETEKEILRGQLQFVDINFNFLRLSCVRDLKNNFLYTSLQLIPVNRIKSIQTLNDQDEHSLESATESTSNSDSSGESRYRAAKHTEINKVKNILPQVALTPFELELLQKKISSVRVLNFRGSGYESAIADIKSQSCIALAIEPHRSGRNRKTSVITIATESSVYIFDIVSIGRLLDDLNAILKAERPYKAMHNSRLVADHFEHRHSMQINGISDIFVAYCIVTRKKENIDLEDIVAQYFGISKDFFEKLDESHIIYSRPLNENFIRNCAKKVSFILKLNECLQKDMLKTYFSQCKSFSRTYADNEDSSEVANSIEIKDNSGHQYIQALDLRDQRL